MAEIQNTLAPEEDDEVPIIEDVQKDGALKRDKLPVKDYYRKWDNFTADEVDSLEEEEKKGQEESDRLLGKDKAFASEAHKKDKTTHLALKEAKKIWDRRRDEEINQKFELCDLIGVTKVLTSNDLGGKNVLSLKNCQGCVLELPPSLVGMIKLFVEGCVDTKVTLRCKLITSHVEVSHCDRVEVSVQGEELHTLQVDLSKSVRLTYGPGLFKPEHKVYSAGCLDLSIACAAVEGFGGKDLTARNDYIADLAPMVLYTGEGGAGGGSSESAKEGGEAAASPPAPAAAAAVPTTTAAAAVEEEGEELPSLVVGSVPFENAGSGATESDMASNSAQASFSDTRSEEQHFITRLVAGSSPGSGGLVTEVAVQVGNRWVTRSELDLETANQAEVTAREMLENSHRAETEKLSGNQSFGSAEYSQAAVHYTVAIDLASTADSQSTQFPQPVNPLIHVCYSNRAACFLKLGQHERALADADSCIGCAPDLFVKGHFRRGLALHAMGRYAEALPSLGKALRLENPKLKKSVQQIQEAVTFAEAKLNAEMRKRNARS